jgi:hypothetical protein
MRAMEIARRSHQTQLASEIEQRLRGYAEGRAYLAGVGMR